MALTKENLTLQLQTQLDMVRREEAQPVVNRFSSIIKGDTFSGGTLTYQVAIVV